MKNSSTSSIISKNPGVQSSNTRRRYSALFPVWASMILFGITSCTEDPPPTLYYQDREIIDSLFLDTVGVLRPRLDSLCETRQDSMVAYLTDSLLEARMRVINEYLKSIDEENPDGIQ